MSKAREENIREIIKRFDDIFRMILIVISIALSLGVGNVNFVLIFCPLFIWILGHAFGQKYVDLEIQAKLAAWFHASFIAIAVLMKLLIDSNLLPKLKVVCFICSVISTFFVFRWFFGDTLDEELKYRLKRRLWQWIIAIIPLIVYAEYI